MSKLKKSLLIVFTVVIPLISILYALALVHDQKIDEEWILLELDYYKHHQLFERIISNNGVDGFKVILKDNYDKTDKDLMYLFENLQYRFIRFDGQGDALFEKYGGNFDFKGLAYSKYSKKHLESLKSKIIKTLNENPAWYLYSDYSL